MRWLFSQRTYYLLLKLSFFFLTDKCKAGNYFYWCIWATDERQKTNQRASRLAEKEETETTFSRKSKKYVKVVFSNLLIPNFWLILWAGTWLDYKADVTVSCGLAKLEGCISFTRRKKYMPAWRWWAITFNFSTSFSPYLFSKNKLTFSMSLFKNWKMVCSTLLLIHINFTYFNIVLGKFSTNYSSGKGCGTPVLE